MITQTTKPVAYAANAYYRKSSHFAFLFVKSEVKSEKIAIEKDKLTEALNENTSNFWRVASFVCIGICLGLGFIEAHNIAISLAGIFNADNSEQMSSVLLYLLGFTFACMGLFLGYGLYQYAETDHITGRRKLTVKWWICLVLSIVYIYAQYQLATIASIGTDADSRQIIQSQTIFALFIALVELLFGYLFLHTAIEHLFVFRLKLILTWQRFWMNRSAKACDENWSFYIAYLHDYNISNPYNHLVEQEETENIRKAKFYYRNP